ncbi:MAG: AarF/UbiB family protein [Acidimicrobiales bacterium]
MNGGPASTADSGSDMVSGSGATPTGPKPASAGRGKVPGEAEGQPEVGGLVNETKSVKKAKAVKQAKPAKETADVKEAPDVKETSDVKEAADGSKAKEDTAGTFGGIDHIAPPRVFARYLPPSSSSELLHRWNAIAKIATSNFAPVAFRQIKQIRAGALPVEALGGPLRQTFEALGGTFMKFGQMIASSPGVFGDKLADEFRVCLDTGPRVGFARIKQRIEADLGMSVEDAYAEVETEPIGRASIAVVHKARLHDGTVVAVKILRPGIHRVVATDLDMLQPIIELVANQTGDETAGWFLQILDGFREQIGEELDLRNEARAMIQFKTLLHKAGLHSVVVPQVIPELSGRNVLTMELLDGEPIDDLAAAARFGIDPSPLVAEVVRAFFLMTIRWGVFHGDVHAGNLMLMKDGRIGVLDWGIVGRLDAETHKFFVRIIQGALGNEDAWDDVAAHLIKTYGPAIRDGFNLNDDQLSDFVKGLVEPILTQPFGEVSLSTLLTAPQTQLAKARGQKAHEGSIRSVITRVRDQRRIRREAEAYGGMDSDFDRGTFLLAKQLMYFERYGKMFMADTPILSDRAFFESLVTGMDLPV